MTEISDADVVQRVSLRSRRGPNVLLLAAGLLQLVSLFTPAVRVRLYGVIPFLRLPNAGVALLVLGVVAVLLAFLPRGWWRWVPGALTAAILIVAHWKIAHAPSGTFIDPLLRRTAHPAWGFVPISMAAALALGAAALRSRSTESSGVSRDGTSLT